MLMRCCTLVLLIAASACQDRGLPDAAAARVDSAGPDPSHAEAHAYERHVVFIGTGADSAFIVPWQFTARTHPGGVAREIRGWLARAGSWDPFLKDQWNTPPSRAPWRILPHGSVRLMIGPDEALDRIVFEEDVRQLEVVPGTLLAEWSGNRGGRFRLHEGATLLSNRRASGYVLDVTRARRGGDPEPGDWAFLASGDSLALFLEDPGGDVGIAGPRYRIWARVDVRSLQWPEATVVWVETRAFEPARRDVPVRWMISTPSGEVAGDLAIENAHVEAGEGAGPLLPVEALYEVAGTIRIEGRDLPVRGLFRHLQR